MQASVRAHTLQKRQEPLSLVIAFVIISLRNVLVDFSDNPTPEDNPYYKWIQDLVSGKRTREELASELRRNSKPMRP